MSLNTDNNSLQAASTRWIEVQREALDAMLEAVTQSQGDNSSEEDLAEGHRWLTRISRVALDWVVERGDPRHPVLFGSQDEYNKLMGDNPDVNYHFCVLDPSRRYRLHGSRGEASYMGLTFGSDIFGTEGLGGTTLQRDLDSFEATADGGCDIVLGGPPMDGNWIELPPDTAHLAIRETFHDRSTQQPACLSVELLDRVEPPRLETDDFARSLERAGNFLLTVVNMCVQTYRATGLLVNNLAGASGDSHTRDGRDQIRGHSDADMHYMGGRFRLKAGEALEIKIPPVEKPFTYWGLTLLNPWLESYDYRFRTISMNDRQARRDADGGWTLTVAAEDPGTQNWLDTGGRREGMMLLRWIQVIDPPQPVCRLA